MSGPSPVTAAAPRALVIIPTYNERENLTPIVDEVLAVSDRLDVLIVDDGSPDGTGKLADSLAAADPRVHVHHRSGKLGLATAYLTGFEIGAEAGFPYLFEFDADGSHPASRIPAMLDELDASADLVIGSRYTRGGGTENWPLRRELLSRAASLYCRFWLGSRIRDITAGFRGYRAEALRGLDLESIGALGFVFQIEMAWRCERRGLRVVEVPIVFRDRVLGASKMRSGIILEALWRVAAWGIGARIRGLQYRLTGR